MQCLDDSLLQMLVEGTLEGPEKDVVYAHVRTCTACKEIISAYKQLMWDLEHPRQPDVPAAEMAELNKTLMAVWEAERSAQKRAKRRSTRSFIPVWAGYSVQWARHVPPIDFVGGVITWAGGRLIDTVAWLRRRGKAKGGERR